MQRPPSCIDSLFEHIKSNEGLQGWEMTAKRISVMNKVDVPLYEDDVYLFLSTKEEDFKRTFKIHYWCGRHAPVVKRGFLAFKVMELHSALKGDAVHYREMQGKESVRYQKKE